MTEEEEVQKELKEKIFGCDSDKFDRHELLEDIFKMYVAKLFELNLGRKGANRIELGVMVEVKRRLIDTFVGAELGEYQKSIKWYEDTFDETVQEILNDAAKAHQGSNVVSVDQTLEINKDAYVKEGGLFVPEHMKK